MLYSDDGRIMKRRKEKKRRREDGSPRFVDIKRGMMECMENRWQRDKKSVDTTEEGRWKREMRVKKGDARKK